MAEEDTSQNGNENSEMINDSIVLEEEIDPNYVPSEEEVIEYAKWLGMDLQTDNDLYWVAREGLMAPLPKNWKPCKTRDSEEIYYFNFVTGASSWDHPCDEYYKSLYEEEKKKKEVVLKAKNDQKRTKVKTDVEEMIGKGEKKKGKTATAGGLSSLAPLALAPLGRKPLPNTFPSSHESKECEEKDGNVSCDNEAKRQPQSGHNKIHTDVTTAAVAAAEEGKQSSLSSSSSSSLRLSTGSLRSKIQQIREDETTSGNSSNDAAVLALQTQLKEADRNLNEQIRKNDRLQEQLSAAEKQVRRDHDYVNEIKQECADLETDLKRQLQSVKAKSTAFKEERDQLDNEVDRLREELKHAKTSAVAASVASQEESRSDLHKQEHEAQQLRIVELNELVESLRAQLTETMKAGNLAASQALEEKKLALDSMQALIDTSEGELLSVQQENRVLLDTIENGRTELAATNQKYRQHLELSTEAQNKYDVVMNDMHTLRVSASTEQEDSCKRIADLDGQIASLKKGKAHVESLLLLSGDDSESGAVTFSPSLHSLPLLISLPPHLIIDLG